MGMIALVAGRRGDIVRLLGAASIVLIAFNARPLFSSAASVLPQMAPSLRLSGAQVSIISALPIICMGLFAPLGGHIGKHLGLERALLLAVLLLSVSLILRSAGPLSLVYAGTALAGLAIAVVNVLLPVLVKRRFADRVPLLTSLYTTGIGAGAAAGAAATIPVARAFGFEWRQALLCWLVPTFLALFAIAALVIFDPQASGAPPPRRRRLWGDRLALSLTLFFGLHSGLAYTVFTWLAPILTTRGMASTTAGYVVALTIAGQMLGTMGAPFLAARMTNQRLLNVGLALGSALLLSSLLFCPLPLAKWLGPLQGLFQGSLLAVSMMLIVVRSADPETATGVSAMVQSAGMIGAGTTPFLVGLLFETTRSLGAPAALILVIGSVAALVGNTAGRSGMVSGAPGQVGQT